MSEEKSWWSRRSTLEKSLIDIVVIGFLLSIGLLVGLIIVAVRGNNEDDSCKTKNCVETSAKILSKMDLTIDPCENFYEFACGNFLRETVIPDDKASITPFNIVEDELRIQLRKIVLETPKQNEILPFQNVRKLFNMCMNTTEIGSLENVPLLNVLETLGSWPVLDDSWDDSEWSWQTFHAQSKQYGFKILSLFEILVDTDFKETTKRVVVIDQPTLGLEREYLIKALDEPYVRAYQQYQVDLAILLGAQPTKAQNEMQQALEFEFKLAEISKSREERRDAMVDYNKLTVAELQSRFPYNNWLEYLNSILPEKVQLKSEDSVVTFNIDFLEKIGNLLSSSSKRDVANYLSWLVVMNSVNFLPNKLRERKHEFDKILTGKEEQEVRWQECIDVTLEQYAHAFGALYVRRHFNREAKKIVLEMVDNIKTEFDANLNTIDWMDDETRKIAKAKLLAMTEEIGFADELLDNDKVNELYKDFPALIDGQYFNSISKLKSAAIDKSLLKLSAPVNTSDWTEQLPPAIVMAYYYSLENTIKFPAAFLQGVFFNPDRPQYTNYGAVGLAIGHEITHGFDDQGSQFDADGNLNEWWAPETKQKFLEKAKCIVEQYSNFTEPQTNLRVNGINTQGENIADNGGVKYAYRGYNQWIAKNGAEQKLPGLDYTALQLFWISVGQMWCSVSRDEEMKNTILLGDHSPAEFRVVGPVSNSEDFAKDFNCKRASRMNPVDKCDVW